jgi:hypothetical protein
MLPVSLVLTLRFRCEKLIDITQASLHPTDEHTRVHLIQIGEFNIHGKSGLVITGRPAAPLPS